MTTGFITLGHQNINAEIDGSTRLFRRSDRVDNQRTCGFCTIHVGCDVAPEEGDDPSAGRECGLHPLMLVPFEDGPVAKFGSEPTDGRMGSAFKLGCPRMAAVTCGPARPIP